MRARPFISILFLSSLILTACGREEEPVANRFARQKADIEKKARAIEAQVEKDVSAVEAELENETAALLNSLESRPEGAAAPANGQQP